MTGNPVNPGAVAIRGRIQPVTVAQPVQHELVLVETATGNRNRLGPELGQALDTFAVLTELETRDQLEHAVQSTVRLPKLFHIGLIEHRLARARVVQPTGVLHRRSNQQGGQRHGIFRRRRGRFRRGTAAGHQNGGQCGFSGPAPRCRVMAALAPRDRPHRSQEAQ